MENLDQIKTREMTVLTGREAMIFGLDDEDKIEKFEEMMSGQLDVSDTLNEAIEKMVKISLSVEFGPQLLQKKFAGQMIKTIAHGILSDSELRKQSLLIMDKFAKAKELNA